MSKFCKAYMPWPNAEENLDLPVRCYLDCYYLCVEDAVLDANL